jgi:hypothetical protein
MCSMNARDHTSIAQERIRAEIDELIAAPPGTALTIRLCRFFRLWRDGLVSLTSGNTGWGSTRPN